MPVCGSAVLRFSNGRTALFDCGFDALVRQRAEVQRTGHKCMLCLNWCTLALAFTGKLRSILGLRLVVGQ